MWIGIHWLVALESHYLVLSSHWGSIIGTVAQLHCTNTFTPRDPCCSVHSTVYQTILTNLSQNNGGLLIPCNEFFTLPDMCIGYCYVHKYPTANVADVQQEVRDYIPSLRLHHIP